MSNVLKGRNFLLLQGPQSRFFSRLADRLRTNGAVCTKVQFCGGDVLLWGLKNSVFYRGNSDHWLNWIGKVFDDLDITDMCLYGDCRPLHWEAVQLAEFRRIRVWVFEEGYLREGYSTLEEHGVNGRSPLPRDKREIERLANNLLDSNPPVIENRIEDKVYQAIAHHVGNVILWPVFYRYKTHRPMNIGLELLGILPRYLKRKDRIKDSKDKLKQFDLRRGNYFFMPLQLNSDSQIQRYSPYSKMREAIVEVLSSFALHSPADCRLLIRNHPLDNGLIHYKNFVASLAANLGIANRVTFVEDGPTRDMVRYATGVVLVNSTVGLMALDSGVPLFCLGQSVFDIDGLTQNIWRNELNKFWQFPKKPDPVLFSAFKKVLKECALIEGNFYTPAGIEHAVESSIRRFTRAQFEVMPVQHHFALVSLREVKQIKELAG
jgi:capsular polysaccharide export protein